MQVLELGGRAVAESRVKSLDVVGLLDEGGDGRASGLDVAIVSSVDLLVLEGLHEAFRLGVVVGVADAAHAGADAMSLEQRAVVGTGVLHAAIGMMDQAVRRRAAR